MKTLKEIANEIYLEIIDLNDDDICTRKIMKACLDFAKSIVPEEIIWKNFLQITDRCEGVGHNSCRSQILSSISEAEKRF